MTIHVGGFVFRSSKRDSRKPVAHPWGGMTMDPDPDDDDDIDTTDLEPTYWSPEEEEDECAEIVYDALVKMGRLGTTRREPRSPSVTKPPTSAP